MKILTRLLQQLLNQYLLFLQIYLGKKKRSKKNSKKSKKEKEILNSIPKDPDMQRAAQLQSMKTDSTILRKREDEKFDMVIEDNDSDYEHESSENEEPHSPYKDLIAKPALVKQLSKSEKKQPKAAVKMARIHHEAKSIERPVQVAHFEVNNNLLAKWENQYGGKEKRKFHEDQERYKNSWDFEDQKDTVNNGKRDKHHNQHMASKDTKN